MVTTRESVETRLRELYAAFGRGDMAGVLGYCTDDITFRVPGRNQVAGAYDKAGFPGMVGTVMQLSGGTFREEIIDVMPGEQYGAVLLEHTFQRDGNTVSYRTIHLWEARGDRFCNWWEYPQDLHAFDAAWR